MAISIGEVATRLGIAQSAIRYYEAEGLIRPPRNASGIRLFDDDAVRQVTFIARAREAGLNIADIGKLVGLASATSAESMACTKARGFALAKIAELDRQIEAAKNLRARLHEAAQRDCPVEHRCAVLGEL
ncbi:MerR family transcriptional regulator [Altererythrobacter sp. MF3-039]|uniref:MerR family transcriptional regulator n=1 Tax=Altererythrobacter sp. MF3-039 TaxID=3252901 RepID=UPI00390C9A9C